MAINVTYNGGSETDTFQYLKQSGRKLLRNSSGVPYVVVENTTEGSVCVYKGNSATPTSFSEQDASNNPTSGSYPIGNPAAAIDSTNVIHIVYVLYNGKTSQLLYCKFRADGTNDDFQNVGTVVVSDLDADPIDIHNVQPDIAIDANGKPHVAFRNDGKSSDWTIQYINNVDGSWNSGVYYEVEGETNGKLVSYPSIAIDADNKPVISYLNDTDDDIGTAIGNVNDATSFTLYDIHSAGYTGMYNFHAASIAVDSDGNHHVAYTTLEGSTDLEIHCRTHNCGDAWTTWQTDEVVNGSFFNADNTPHNISLAINGTDRYIFIEDLSSNYIDYYYDIGAGWVDGGTLETGTYNTPIARWGFWVNNDSGGSAIEVQSEPSAGAAAAIFGDGDSYEAAGQSFQVSQNISLNGVFFKVNKVASPTDNLQVKIRTGSMTGTVVATSDNIAGSSLTTTATLTKFTFSTPPPLSSGTTYYLELLRTGSRDTTNYYQVAINTAGTYSSGSAYRKDSSNWTIYDPARDYQFLVYESFASELDYIFEDQTASPDILFNSLSLGAAGTNMKLNISDDWKTVASMKINIGDSWKTVTAAKINIGDSWKTIF